MYDVLFITQTVCRFGQNRFHGFQEIEFVARGEIVQFVTLDQSKNIAQCMRLSALSRASR